jgi:predicted transposase/invertase (TIGR01784 family)
MSILTAEWNWDTAKRIWQDEAREEGLSQGREEGIGVGLSRGREVEREEIARNALEEGVSDETIQKITGLSLDEIRQLKN